MAISNKERVGRALDALCPELAKFVEQEIRSYYGDDDWTQYLAQGPGGVDTQRLLNTIINEWQNVFEPLFEEDHQAKQFKSTVHDVRTARNKVAHETAVSFDDSVSHLIKIQQLLEAIRSPVSEEVERSKMEIMRLQFETERKKEEKKAANVPISGLDIAGLRPWREIIAPHEDVAKGTFQQAEFAADLWQVYQGQGSEEYRNPVAFFGRTYLTGGLSELLVNGLKRLKGEGGDPVVELQINFGGGKTHSMLALYHLFGGQAKASDLPGVDALLKNAAIADVPVVRRAVLVGTALRPGSPLVKEDGTEVRTLWGEIAWQLAGRQGFDIVRQADETATNPGDLMDEVFRLAGPSLILIDEWVAYARQLFDRQKMLPAGDFDTQFTFAQTLCEAARRAKNVLVCISIPASIGLDGNTVVSGQAGDLGGQSALQKLKDAVGRSNLVWRPAQGDETFEIVRRRLFQSIPGDLEAARDAVVREFVLFYRANRNEFPAECSEGDYERRMKTAYPIHPELFDRLYEDWSTLEKFQRTRGVLRFMAAVIHSLWVNNDSSSLILPAVVPLADPNVQTEILRYLPENWPPVLDRDVDGAKSVPMKLDGEFASSFGRFSASRRVARTIFIGSAPTKDAATRGTDEKHVRLGCVQPKETIATFGDSLARLRQRTMYLYQDGSKYWYNTQASINREAHDRAENLSNEEVSAEIVRRLRELTKTRGEFGAIHVEVPSGEVDDNRELRLVVLGPQALHKRGQTASPAVALASEYLKFRGSAPRANQNRLVFLAGDEVRCPDLLSGVRQFLAWKSIVDDVHSGKLDLDKANRDQATASVNQWTATCTARVTDTYQHILAPVQTDPTKEISWAVLQVGSGNESLATRIVKKLEPEHIVRNLGGTVLLKDLDRIPLWGPDGFVSVDQLASYYAHFVYLYRLLNDSVLHHAARDAVNRMDGPGYADAYDEESKEFTKLRAGILLEGSKPLPGVLVKAELANAIIDEENRNTVVTPEPESRQPQGSDVPWVRPFVTPKTSAPSRKRFHASIRADAGNLASVAGNVSREVAAQLASTVGSRVRITIEIEADCENGFSDHTARVVNENCRTLKFDFFEFEEM